ncbi:zinc finger protein BRUTUS isoform X2 [Ziziphus jujuba]|uniref:Zinc finger protein BRUTUS isoform X2 n=1 Tax=Ziziphus jujuba TaxID=326968 RepID=A0ABM4AGS7_ZIZJJ|nr:zinc finger protein BRUTUS isoform X2 [Ziziphus jujuba]
MPLMGLKSREGVASLSEQKSPILFLYVFHKAIRNELDGLHQWARAYASGEHDNIGLLFERFCFLGSIYKHQLSAKDEVIFAALDTRVKGIAQTYSIQHKGEKNVFDKLFEQLNSIIIHNKQGSLQRELETFFGVLRLLVSKNMANEEEQVFPLMNEKFSFEDQASLICQFLCSIPTFVLSKLLSWLPTSISTDEYQDLCKCLSQILPHQKLFQQAIFNWTNGIDHTCDHCSVTHQMENANSGNELNKSNPIDDILLWHIAIKRELNDMFEKAKRLYISGNFSERSAFSKSMQFISEICIFHSIAEDKVILPAVYGEASFFNEHAHEEETQFMEFMHLFQSAREVSVASSTEFYSKLCTHADKIMHTINMHFHIEEDQVLPLSRKLFDAKRQLELLYQSFCLMPLKLIERVLPWLVRTLNHEQSLKMLNNLKLAAPARDIALVTLFSDWASNDGNLQSVCQSSCETGFSPINSSAHLVDDFSPKSFYASSSALSAREILNTNAVKPLKTESGGSGFRILNNDNINNKDDLSSTSCSAITTTSFNCSLCGSVEQPIDVIYIFHKAIRRDMEYIDIESGKIGTDGDETFLQQFIGRFYLSWVLYRNHSNAEDNILYPALESKQVFHNVSSSYVLDHEEEERMFQDISTVLSELSRVHGTMMNSDMGTYSSTSTNVGDLVTEFSELASKLKVMCKSIRIMVDRHMLREEMELWPLFGTHFSVEEQYKMLGFVLGTTSAEVLQLFLTWVFSALSEDEQTKMMNTLKKVTKNTMFDEWLNECWKGTSKSMLQQKISKTNVSTEGVQFHGSMDQSDNVLKPIKKDIFHLNQDELKLENMKVYLDPNSNRKRKAGMLKYHMSRHWIAAGEQRKAEESREKRYKGETMAGKSASFRDVGKKVLGCEHYKRNCKLLASCCGNLFTCRFCHDTVSDHLMDWKTTSEMMCMRCLNIQPIGPICMTPSCNRFPMASYFCNICKLFDDERIGRGLGIDYFHCMSCNCCLSMNFVKHKCREKCLEAYCPVCNEYLFTSSAVIKALPCGHFIHSACLRASTWSHYTCLVCNQSSEDTMMAPTQSSPTAKGNKMVFYKCGHEKAQTETSCSNSNSKSSSFGLARFWAKKLSTLSLGFGSPVYKCGRMQITIKVLNNLGERHRDKDSCLMFCFLTCSLVVLCVITIAVVFLWHKIVGEDKYHINFW